MTEDAIRALRQALACSPDNLPLRRHLAATLLGLGRADEAADEYQAALRLAPGDGDARLGLARCFHRLGRHGEALVLCESLCTGDDAPAAASVLLARLLHREGSIAEAVAAYRAGVGRDAACADPDLAEALGIDGDDDAELHDGRLRAAAGGAEADPTGVEHPQRGFDQVGGMGALKEEIRLKIIHPLSNPDLYKAYGKKVGGGILLYGPPGCGKTHLARAVAGEIKASFLSVGIADVLEMWIGSSERNLARIFSGARANRPCVLFFDEVDALASRRSDLRASSGRMVINQFLAELDGVDSDNDGLLVLAATNAPWHVDPAFRRPGRFDRVVFVPPPDAEARAEILRIMVRDKPAEDVDAVAVARKTAGFSGADLRAVVERATEDRLAEALRAGSLRPLRTRDLLQAAKALRPSANEWFDSARNHALYANQGGLYDDVLAWLKNHR